MRRVNTDQNVVIALFLNIMFLNCTLQDFSYLSEPFCPRTLESATVGHISIKIQFKPPKNFFYHSNPIFNGLRHKTSKHKEM